MTLTEHEKHPEQPQAPQSKTDWATEVRERWDAQRPPARHHLAYQTRGPVPYLARITLREVCQTRGLSIYQIAMSGAAQGTVDPGTVYRLARGDTSRIDLHTLATLAGIIHAMTGQPIGIDELLGLTIKGDAAPCFGMPEIDAWREKKTTPAKKRKARP